MVETWTGLGHPGRRRAEPRPFAELLCSWILLLLQWWIHWIFKDVVPWMQRPLSDSAVFLNKTKTSCVYFSCFLQESTRFFRLSRMYTLHLWKMKKSFQHFWEKKLFPHQNMEYYLAKSVRKAKPKHWMGCVRIRLSQKFSLFSHPD